MSSTLRLKTFRRTQSKTSIILDFQDTYNIPQDPLITGNRLYQSPIPYRVSASPDPNEAAYIGRPSKTDHSLRALLNKMIFGVNKSFASRNTECVVLIHSFRNKGRCTRIQTESNGCETSTSLIPL